MISITTFADSPRRFINRLNVVSEIVKTTLFLKKIIAFSPQFQLRGSRVAPFARVMVGASRRQFSGLLSSTPSNFRDTAFAVGTGGGLDIKINKHVWLRPIQADYLMTRFDPLDQYNPKTQHHLRLAAGIVIRLR